jgi:hypothetical protein
MLLRCSCCARRPACHATHGKIQIVAISLTYSKRPDVLMPLKRGNSRFFEASAKTFQPIEKRKRVLYHAGLDVWTDRKAENGPSDAYRRHRVCAQVPAWRQGCSSLRGADLHETHKWPRLSCVRIGTLRRHLAASDVRKHQFFGHL